MSSDKSMKQWNPDRFLTDGELELVWDIATKAWLQSGCVRDAMKILIDEVIDARTYLTFEKTNHHILN